LTQLFLEKLDIEIILIQGGAKPERDVMPVAKQQVRPDWAIFVTIWATSAPRISADFGKFSDSQ